MAFIHEQLYHSSNFTSIEFSEYVNNLVTYLLHSHALNPRLIKLNINVDDVSLDLNTSIPCGLIINELVTNSLKHAFKNGENGKICISLHSIDDNKYVLIVQDNGIGFPEDFDLKNTESLGLQIVNSLVMQLDGTMKVVSDNGVRFEIIFNKIVYKERI